MLRKSLVSPLIYAIILTFASCGEKNFENSGAVWGTTYHISYSAPRDLGDSIISVMRCVELELSMFDSTSTVSRINRGETPVVGPMFNDVFQLSKNISIMSGGAFDPTVGPLTELWGFGKKRLNNGDIPSDSAINCALIAVGIDSCFIIDGKVVKKHPQTTFDFSSVAKGYGVDAVAAMLRRNGVQNYLVEIGGEIYAEGINSNGRTWHVQIDAPVYDSTATHTRMYIIPLSGRAVATSGNYRNFRDTDGGRIGHTLDPHTGRPVISTTASATIIAPDCATADALATACMVMNPDSALLLIEKLDNTEALIATAQSDSITLTFSSGFPAGI